MTSTPAAGIPVGDIQLFDDYQPALAAGDWYLDVTHEVLDGTQPVNDKPLTATQEVVVTAPQFALDPNEIVTQFPPNSSTGQFGEVLPHVVLSEPMLPWERNAGAAKDPQPWLALLVLTPGEVVGAGSSGTGAVATTVGAFLAPPGLHDPSAGAVFKPPVVKADDVADDSPMSYVEIPAPLFAAIAPRLAELRFLTHCRQVNTDDKAPGQFKEHGLFSVVIANRFPERPTTSDDAPIKSIAHLVSVEALADQLVAAPDFKGAATVALVSLASWTFWTQGDSAEDFAGLANALVKTGQDEKGNAVPDSYRLRVAADRIDRSKAAGAEAGKRLDDGFVALPYATRSGEATFGWYRGPFTPYPATALGLGPFTTADAAIVYQPKFGVFDMSLAAAFEAGRTAALSDKAFGQRLLDFRRRGHRFVDLLHERLEADHFSDSDIKALSGATVQDELRAFLKRGVLRQRAGTVPGAPPPPAPSGPDQTPKEALQALLARGDVQRELSDAVAADLQPVATWLARLMLLQQVPFDYLVPNEAMLPLERLRVFHVDSNWLDAALDGALAIGIQSSRDEFFHQIFGDVIRQSALDVLGPPPVSGLLLRSRLVSGWPTLAIRAADTHGAPTATVRIDRLAPDTLLCLFKTAPATVSICEPQEGFRFGVDLENGIGYTLLRNLVAGTRQVGEQLTHAPPFAVYDPTGKTQLHTRAAGSRVLDIAPDSTDGLVQKLTAAVDAAAGTKAGTFGPADFALQMINAPEAIEFNSPGGP